MSCDRGWRFLKNRPARIPAGQRGRLFQPVRPQCFVEFVAFADVDPAGVLAAHRATGRDRLQRRAAEEGHLDISGEDVDPEEPA